MCHTVRPDVNDDGTVVYQAESPDEKALVDAARDAGFRFVDSLDQVMEVDALGTTERYKLLHVIEFNSARKRMSVVVRLGNGRIRLICKGADNVMLARMRKAMRARMDVYARHMDAFARKGLRTLVFGAKYAQQ